MGGQPPDTSHNQPPQISSLIVQSHSPICFHPIPPDLACALPRVGLLMSRLKSLTFQIPIVFLIGTENVTSLHGKNRSQLPSHFRTVLTTWVTGEVLMCATVKLRPFFTQPGTFTSRFSWNYKTRVVHSLSIALSLSITLSLSIALSLFIALSPSLVDSARSSSFSLSAYLAFYYSSHPLLSSCSIPRLLLLSPWFPFPPMVQTRKKNKSTRPAAPVMSKVAKVKAGIPTSTRRARAPTKDEQIRALQAQVIALQNPDEAAAISRDPLVSWTILTILSSLSDSHIVYERRCHL